MHPLRIARPPRALVECITTRLRSPGWIVVAALTLWLLAGMNAFAACPAGQFQYGSSCLCDNGTSPGQLGCVQLSCTNTPGQLTPNGTCCAANTIPQPNNTCPPTVVTQGPPPVSFCAGTGVVQADGSCLCLNGNPPPANGNCPIFHPCTLTGTCCPPGQQTGAGTCCPQGQVPMADGSCVLFDVMVARNFLNNALCLPGQTLMPNGTCQAFPGMSACTYAPPLSTSQYAPPCCGAGQLPATTGVPPSATGAGTLTYTGTCCPVGQVAQANGSCLPKQTFIAQCPGGADFNAWTNSCCPNGGRVTNHYTCCPPGQTPQPNGSCGCPSWEMQLSDGTCTLTCGDSAVWLGNGSCNICPNGQQVASQTNTCCPSNRLTTAGVCCGPDTIAQGAWCYGTQPQIRQRRADCAPGETRRDDGSCGPPQCGGGLVPRDAFRGDGVCVPRAVRDQTIADNAVAPTRTRPDGGCVRGYVWREASAADHVCVPPATRTQVWSDNRHQCGGDIRCARGVTTRMQGPVVTHGGVPAPPKIVFRPTRNRDRSTTRTTTHDSRQQRTSFHRSGSPGAGSRNRRR
jgi:hypothetical protein